MAAPTLVERVSIASVSDAAAALPGTPSPPTPLPTAPRAVPSRPTRFSAPGRPGSGAARGAHACPAGRHAHVTALRIGRGPCLERTCASSLRRRPEGAGVCVRRASTQNPGLPMHMLTLHNSRCGPERCTFYTASSSGCREAGTAL
eukprot:239752-Chlamydomonas_euryale.AAC.9